VQGAILLVSGIFVGMNLLVDVVYTYINPKIRFE
jgi:ABC-type dipeptide/oligopeptide/nickel transport system permease component